LSVQDTGFGIAKENLDKVFEPFFTTKDTGRGSGLGLSMIYGYVKQSNGHVRIDSDVGAGTTVRLYLPRHHPADHAPSLHSPTRVAGVEGPLPKAKPGEAIMVVEDNEDVRRLAVDTLESLGYRVVAASDAKAALAAFNGGDTGQLDLLFTDVVLPNGISGSELAEMVCAQRPGLPVLFASGYTRSAMPRERSLADAQLLQKPYSIDTLAIRCRQAIDRSR
jgi:CheY-like chemotaxis protein